MSKQVRNYARKAENFNRPVSFYPHTRAVLGGGSNWQLVRAGFWRQMDNQRTTTSSMRKAGLHRKYMFMA